MLLHCAFQEASVACSTKIALEWDEAFKNMNDPSGRAVANVHTDSMKGGKKYFALNLQFENIKASPFRSRLFWFG
jgi:hypothetical protein